MKNSKQRGRLPVGKPSWFHPHGDKIRVMGENKELLRLNLVGSVAQTGIAFTKILGGSWRINNSITHTTGSSDCAVFLTAAEMRAAFGISDSSGSAEHLCDRYGADSAEQGKYIRLDDYLNIPGPGTGLDGDPNLSIRITREIRLAVSRLLKAAQSAQ